MASRAGLEFLPVMEKNWPSEEHICSTDSSSTDSSSSGGSDDGSSGARGSRTSSKKDSSGSRSPVHDDWIAAGSAADLSWLHFALYKRSNRLKDWSVAWAYLEAGNKLMASTGRYTPDAEREAMQQVMQIFAGPFDGSVGYRASKGAIFIVGAPRSGSTLIEQMLGSHSEVRGAGVGWR